MIHRARKRTLFIFGVILASIAGLASGHVRSNYSKEGSLFLPNVAHADSANWNWTVGGSGDGCGGCSSDSSAGASADSGSGDSDAGDGSCCY